MDDDQLACQIQKQSNKSKSPIAATSVNNIIAHEEQHSPPEADVQASESNVDRSMCGQNHPTLSQKICESPDNDSVVNFHLPENAHNRVGRWTGKEINNLKLGMGLFGDQAWRKIQRFLI